MELNSLYYVNDFTYITPSLRHYSSPQKKVARGELVLYLNENIGSYSKVLTQHGPGYIQYVFLTQIT